MRMWKEKRVASHHYMNVNYIFSAVMLTLEEALFNLLVRYIAAGHWGVRNLVPLCLVQRVSAFPAFPHEGCEGDPLSW